MMRQTRRMAVDIRSGAQEAVNTYMSSLADLTVNSKPHINALTMLAEDYLNYADAIVKAVDDHLQKVPSLVKLPILYLIDSIIKNVGKVYITLFSRTIVQSFSTVFEQVDEKTRQQMYKLRQTWNEIFPEEHLYAMDVKVSSLDPKWPITASPASQYVAAAPSSQQAPHKIHINPKFFKPSPVTTPVAAVPPAAGGRVSPTLPSNINSSVPSKPMSTQHQVSAPPKEHPDDEAVLLEQLMQRKRNLLQLQQEKEQFKKKKSISKPLEKIAPDTSTISAKEKTPDLPAVFHPNSEEILLVKEIPPKSPEACKVEIRVKEPASGLVHISSNAPRIAPVSSALINLVATQRAQRDPRLSKQPKEEIVIDDSITSKTQGKIRDPRLTVKAEKRSRSSDKETTSKISRHRSRESSAERSSSRHSSRRDERDKRSSESRKSNRKSEERIVSKLKKTSSRSPSKSSSSRSPSKSISSRSPRKSASSRSPSKSNKTSGKHERRKDSSSSPRKTYSGHRPVSDFADSPESDASDSKDSGGATSGPGSLDWGVSFTKGSHKSRNYVRRNLPEKSPELVGSTVSSDVDLRLSAVQENHIQLSSPSDRLHLSSTSSLSAGASEQILPTIASQDVDLRCLPSSPGKKRRSAEPEDGHPPTKKNKAAHMEMLFGKQDVDLRQMDLGNGIASDAPSPPPPPIISSPERGAMLKDVNLGWSKFKQTNSPSPLAVRSPAFPRSSRHDRLGHSSGGSDLDQKEDTDMRNPMNGLETSKPDFEGILKQATEQYKNGTMSHADYSQVQMKVIRMHETAKIREAQRNDYSRRDGWERRPKEKDYRHGLGSSDVEQYGDIDERFQAPGVVKQPLLPLPKIPPVALQDSGRHPRHMGLRMPGPMQGQGYIRPPRSLLGSGPRGPPRGSWRFPRGGAGFKDTIALPPADPFILERIAHDPMKTITIDSNPREIRFYGENAVAMMSADDPREIAFDPGDATVIINEINVCCSFNEPAKDVNINGKTYRLHLGAPTRELYINDEGFECQFNCPPKEVLLATGEILLIQLQSDIPPKVHVGMQRRDLVAGRVMLIIDAETCIPIFLDAKPQRFDIDGVPHVIKFADALDTVLVNNHPFNIKFGGPAVPITVNSARHYIRLTELPLGVVPGEIEIVSMSNHFRTKARPGPGPGMGVPWATSGSGTGQSTGPSPGTGPSPAVIPQTSNLSRNLETDHEPALPVRGGLAVLNRGMPKKIMKPKGRQNPAETLKPTRIEDRQMPADLLQALQPALLGFLPGSNQNTGYNSTPSAMSGAYGMRQNIGAGSDAAAAASTSTSSASSSTFPSSGSEATTSKGSNGIPFIQPDLNIHKLLQSLYDTGLIAKKDNAVKEEKDTKKIHPVDFKDSKSLKVNQPAIIDILYSGIQCSSCGTRFPPEQTEKYSAHLDWHFRQNRRDKDSQRKPQSRKWYYDVSDWIQFEEIDDTLDKAQNWFDTQQTETAKFEEVEEEEIQSIPSKDFPEGTICELCHDKFDQFYNEDKEEWHLKDCLVADGLPYHPFCYKDYRVSVESKDEEQTESVEEAEATAETADTLSEDKDKSALDVKEESEEPSDDHKKIKEEKSDDVGMEEQAGENKSDLEKPLADEECLNTVVKQEVLDDESSSCPEKGLDDKVEGESSEEGNEGRADEVKENEGEEEEGEAGAKKKEEVEADTGPDSHEGLKEEADDAADTKDEPKTLEEKLMHDPITDTTSAVVSCSIDGNLELAQAPATLPAIANRIKINISKPFVKPAEETKDESDKEEESGEDSSEQEHSEVKPIVLKPKLQGRKLKELPPMLKGSETSGLCSIM